MKPFFEKDLEDLIMEHKDNIDERGFVPLFSNTVQQFILPSGKKIDILSYEKKDDDIIVYIIELKRGKTKIASLLQAYEYLDELLEILYGVGYGMIYASVILVGYENTPVPICKFLNCPALFFSYHYDIDGLKFTQQEVVSPHYGQTQYYEGGIVISKNEPESAIAEIEYSQYRNS